MALFLVRPLSGWRGCQRMSAHVSLNCSIDVKDLRYPAEAAPVPMLRDLTLIGRDAAYAEFRRCHPALAYEERLGQSDGFV